MTTDRRVLRTRHALRQAFRDLAVTHQYHDITVKQLTAVANINRKTFYLHYDSIDDLAASFSHESSQEILKIINQQDLRTSFSHSGSIFDQLDYFYHQNKEFYRVVLTSDDYSFLSRRVQNEVARGLTKNIQVTYQLSQADAFLCASFLIHNMLTFFRLYFTNQLDFTPAEFKDRLISLNSYGVHQFFYPEDH
ncbi:TetR/AcrR family transcriptional regulator [Lactiplantibacillus mudanjiangensis]|uniref:TetR family transcriptional regulator [Lactobacillus pentosus] n=1 Tax=Lactiplantibacillus mudanjiangensis TaxID=1296538 RepID=A0A660E299_9LACO|nr:TetR/AcrR family transcriptional regulator [Lactiplantibacillus mudanjiangensis]VDG17871.1 TetR family transcriptional regulator [Lactobacillus pentosus] [Lactiplantibacillus mudanjiangensis]VDG23320.1 TetR family transcriptional regulator [Lactobacillus pentosus] [Lactiplantibacillus mudanjiangensis]VDG28281.1 TetR family transcriptional regulator [Lactobacillus pentosus] [Lactiplantibacillus mudanjiangensis]VDG32431.1 TetR family transcriptional regulator [Lactobacillus pentosus] [Lactipla